MVRIAAIIPAYNEEANIHRVIRDIRSQDIDIKVVVVNDCSTDSTESIVRREGETVLNLTNNLGIGGAVQTGMRFARDEGYDIALQVDGDGQHPASEIKALIEPIRNGNVDVVIGSRFLGKGDFQSSFARRIGIRIISLVNSILVGQRISDNTSGFRAFNRRAIEFLSEHYPQDYPEPVAVVELFRNGFRIAEVPVRMLEREGGESSISSISSIYYMVKVLTASLVAFTRKPVVRKDKRRS